MKKLLLWSCMAFVLHATEILPLEKSIVEGKLPNGLTYHLVRDDKPKDKVEIRLIVHAGSLDENESQRGLAHFVEHMAFNGSKHFKKNELVAYLESIGMSFGGDLNADTNFEQTTYKQSVPVKGDNVQKSLIIARDWADGLDFDPNEFDKERGVILSELRLRNTLGLRTFKQLLPAYFKGSAYADRLPEGKKEVIRHADVSLAKAFYNTWYRPELMDLIVTGDINTTQMAEKIKTIFGTMKNQNHTKRTSRQIPDVNQTAIVNIQDNELIRNGVSLIYLGKNRGLRTVEDKRRLLTESIMIMLFNLRAGEQMLKSNPKAQRISATVNRLGNNLKMVEFYAEHKEGNGLPALKELYALMASFDRYGFSKNNFELAKKKVRFEVEKAYKQIVNLRSNDVADRLTKAIKNHQTYVDYDYDHALTEKLLDAMTLDDVNQAFHARIHGKNRVVAFTDTLGGTVTKDEVLTALKAAQSQAKDLSHTAALPTHLLDKKLPFKKFVSKTTDKQTGIIHYVLENNVTVDFKPSVFSKDRIIMKGYSVGGYSLLSDEAYRQIQHASDWIAASGAGKYTLNQIKKILASKTVEVTTDIQRFGEQILGNSNAQDMESMFELLYLKMTQPKLDPQIFENSQKIVQNTIAHMKRNPDYLFAKAYVKYYFYNNPHMRPETVDEVKRLDRKKMLALFKERFSDFNHFHFNIIGDATPEKVEKLIGTYLANLPVEKRDEMYVAKPYPYRKGAQSIERAFNQEQSTKVTLEYRATVPYSVRNKVILGALSSITKIRLRNSIREEKSGVYTIVMETTMDPELRDKASLTVSFNTAPQRADELIKAARKSIEKVKNEGITLSELSDYQEHLYVMLKKAQKENIYWLDMMMNHSKYNAPLSLIFDAKEMIKSLTTHEIQEMAQKIFSEDSMTAKLTPEQQE